jgi:hypothetical protein
MLGLIDDLLAIRPRRIASRARSGRAEVPLSPR